jgi:hypothetical protein
MYSFILLRKIAEIFQYLGFFSYDSFVFLPLFFLGKSRCCSLFILPCGKILDLFFKFFDYGRGTMPRLTKSHSFPFYP